ncbi:uncharacterized protein [Dysidea avara]|uniref:uncharacterized protein n=1 Tax=Dysidea avara TaxID=196820 RepID=UPI003325803C
MNEECIPKGKVFLGGSCNPTTWRKCTAIPHLEKNALSYYNPQVDEWYPELMEIEEKAKQRATVLLFVIDSCTRAVASMVEASYLAACGRNVVMVVHFFDTTNPTIAGDVLSEMEVKDLNRGRLFVSNIFHLKGIPHFKSLDHALDVTVQIANSGSTNNRTGCSPDNCIVIPVSLVPNETSIIECVFDMYDSDGKGVLSLQEVERALIISLGLSKLPKSVLHTDTLRDSAPMNHDDLHVDCNKFCKLYQELKSASTNITTPTIQLPWLWSLLTRVLWWPFNFLTNIFWSSQELSQPSKASGLDNDIWYDVFLGGTCASSTWRQDITVPLLKEHQVSFFNPHVTCWSEALIPYESRAKEKCCILLYVITGHSTSVGSLVEASYYLGTTQLVVICIQDIDGNEHCLQHLSSRAVRDYNRGRTYLKDAASRKGRPVFSKVEDATMEAIRLAKLAHKN